MDPNMFDDFYKALAILLGLFALVGFLLGKFVF